MSKITSKLQVTVPKALAKIYGLRPGSNVTFDAAGEVIRLVPAKAGRSKPAANRYADKVRALKLFDEATQRQQQRNQEHPSAPEDSDRGWRREDVYNRGLSD